LPPIGAPLEDTDDADVVVAGAKTAADPGCCTCADVATNGFRATGQITPLLKTSERKLGLVDLVYRI